MTDELVAPTPGVGSAPTCSQHAKQKIVVVLGMHRSGTSLLTNLLTVLGVDLGSDLMAADGDNQLGYWENTKIYGVQDALLNYIAKDWGKEGFAYPFAIDWERMPEFRVFHDELVSIVREEIAKAKGIWGFKDPRTCRLLPIWKQIFAELDLEPLYVLAIRHPADVAESLRKRNKFNPLHSEVLWLLHTFEAIRDAGSKLRIVVDYDRWFVTPREQAQAVAKALDLAWPADDSGLMAKLTETIHPDLRHAKAQHSSSLPFVMKTYEALQQAAATGQMPDAIARAEMQRWSERLAAELESSKGLGKIALERGQAKVREGSLEAALADFTQAVQLQPRLNAAHASRALVMSSLARLTEAKESAQQAPGQLANSGLPQAPALARGECSVMDMSAAKTCPVEPLVSIIIPVLNKIELTCQCLEALRQTTPAELCEVIVWDNGSTDGTKAFFQQRPASKLVVRCVRSEVNLGFVGANNAAAQVARGRFLVFLNNDTEPRAGWLEALLQSVADDPRVGAVGAKLIYPNGKLQEAGGIIFRDASGWNYGRMQDPRDPRFNFSREVDYCSAACLLVPAELFRQLGGFDPRYAPAYYEDTDLCFALRKAGYKVVYQPHCEIVHHEGATAGQDLQSGFKRHQVINRQKFFDKWKRILAQQPAPDPGLTRRARHRARGQRILVIDPFLPMYDRASGSRRLFEMLKLLASGGNAVTFLARDGNCPNSQRYVKELERFGVEVYPGDAERMKELGNTLKCWPLDLKMLLQESQYSTVILSFWYLAEQYLSRIRSWSPASRILIDTVDLHFVRERRQAELFGDPKLLQEAEQTYRRELAIYRQADALITVTEDDRQTILREIPESQVFIVPNIHDLASDVPAANERNGLLFVGNFNHLPNGDGVLYFHREIWPRILQRVPAASWTIVGSNAPAAIQALTGPKIKVTGYVPSVEPYLRSHLISIAPLRYGAGMKGKIGEALAHGLPVVTTSIGAEGMGLKSGDNGALVADDPEGFAAHVANLFADRELWNRLSLQGRRNIELNFTPQRIEQQLKTILDWSASFTSIIILAHNQLADTQKCLASIEKHTPPAHELILVDNGSTDGTDKFFQDYAAQHRHARVILNRGNLGFSAGNNQGLACAKGDAIILLNNDTVVTPGWLENMRALFARHPDCGLVGPVSNYVSGPQWVPVTYSELGQMPAFAASWCAAHAGQSAEIPRLVGFCLMLRRTVLDKIGGLDPQFGSGNFEDDDFSIRAGLAGFKLRIAFDSFVHHTGGQTFKGAKINYRASMERNWELFKAKWAMPKDTPLKKGYRHPAAVPAGLTLQVPLPQLTRSHSCTLEGRCWTDKARPKIGPESAPQQAALVRPPCASKGQLLEARDLARKKQWPAAWAATVAAISARPYHPEGYLHLAEIAQAAGAAEAARRCAKEAREMAPDWAPPKQFLRGNLRGNVKPAWLKLPPALAGGNGSAVPRVSVCLIAKNEERFLAQCLRSVKALASQIIVVDTGSTDRSVEIAREFGAEVHSFPWCDDFSAARNAALEHATGDWILILDADEELMPEQADVLAREIRVRAVLGYRLPIVDHGREDAGRNYVQRLFRNAPGLYFIGRIHEQIFCTINACCKKWGLKNVLGQTALLHYGYAPEVVSSRNKIERNLRLLEQAVAEMPGEPTFVMNLGLELVRSGHLEAGLERYWEALHIISALPETEVTPEGRETLLTQLSTYLISANRYSEVVDLWQLPFAVKAPLTASQHFCLGVAHMQLQHFEQAAEQMRQCLAKRHQPALSAVNAEIFRAGPQHCLAKCLWSLRDSAGAQQAFEAALAVDPGSRVVRIDLARFHASLGHVSESLKFLRQLLTEQPADLPTWTLGGGIALGQPGELPAALDWTAAALQHFPDDPTLLQQRAEACLLNQDVVAALPLWRRVMAANPRRNRGAVVLCELLSGDRQYSFSPAEEPAISQEVVQWYRQCIRLGAHGIINQLHEQIDSIRLTLPTFVRIWEAAHRQARLVAA